MDEELEHNRPAETRDLSMIEVFMPLGTRMFVTLYWVAGLSGIVLGTLAINQGFFERFFDIQFLLIAQGVALTAMGGAMFIVATGIISGARWSLDVAKRVAGISIIWSALGVSLAVYSAYNLPGLAYSVVLYGIMVWLLVFGVTVGLVGLRFLYSEDASIRKYAEYTTTEVLSREDRLALPYRQAPVRRLPTVTRGRFCYKCGTLLEEGDVACPKCGAERSL